MSNKNLNHAKSAKNDEFYTQYKDIENELQHYTKHFKNKIVYCNCDTAESNFVKYFQNNFDALGLKDLLYSSNDFRSPESIELLEKCDIVVTNPPFSLFIPFVNQIMENGKKFLIIGNINAIAGKDVFGYFKEERLWFGAWKKDIEFITPNGKKKIKVRWFTNLEYENQYPELTLKEQYDPQKYPKFDNYDAISVKKVREIPYDYNGMMGVPITFVDKYNPKQFKILGMVDYRNESGLRTKIYSKNDVPNPSIFNRGGTLKTDDGYKAVYSRILIQKLPPL